MSVAAGYGAVFRHRGAAPLIVAGILARLPISMTGPGAVLLLRAHTGSSAPGAVLAAVSGLTAAAGGPLWGRLVDRRGARMPLLVTGAIQALALTAIVVSARHGAVAVAVALGVLGGAATPPVTPVLRRWLATLPESLHATAMGMEAVSIEAVFLVGPALVGLTVALAGPAVSLLVAAGAVFAGAVAVAFLGNATATPPDPQRIPHLADAGSLLRLQALRAVVGAEFLQVAAFATTEVAILTAAARDGRAALGGVILATWAASSGVGGLLTTSLWHRPAGQRFVISSASMGACLLLLSVSRNPVALLFLVIPAGMSIAPSAAAGAAILAAKVPAERQAEAFAWGSAMAAPAGGAVGYAIGGGLVQATPLAVVTLTAAALAILAAVIVLTNRRSYV